MKQRTLKRGMLSLYANKNLLSKHPEQKYPIGTERKCAEQDRLQIAPEHIQHRLSKVDAKTILDEVIC